MAILNNDGNVALFNDNSYCEEFEVIDCGDSGSIFVGAVHVPKIRVGCKAFISITFLDGE